MTTTKALVAVDGEPVAIGTAEITWPGPGLGQWKVEVEGLESAYFEKKPARVAAIIGTSVLGGDAMPVQVHEEAITGKRRTTFMGNGPLAEDYVIEP